ncbi:adenosylcobinamide-phosphate synthase CbiB [Candidatus Bipolaricaulota bacterium]|nr:adenosylcobinamide-phosphate synthase CbiB [Candidatus Bipolaricaulota bacterium]
MKIFESTVPVSLVVLFGSVALDLLLGEPPELLHPVVWIGRGIGALKERFEGFERKKLFGGLLILMVVTGAGGAGYLAVTFASDLWRPLGLIVGIYLLKATFSIRSLVRTVRKIGRSIEEDPEEARDQLLALVGRDRADLSRGEMRSAAIESLFENLVDSVISPLFYFTLGTLVNIETGIGFALFFKALNTVDSMIGYRTESLQSFGYLGAKLDDIMNWIPARLSPLLIALGSFSAVPVKLSLRDWGNTSSPNSGWPMSACSGALKVRLIKKSHYVLGTEFDLPSSGDIDKATSLAGKTVGIYLLLLSGIIFLW